MIALCTMFDSAYMKKGLALIESIRRHLPDFALCVLAIDEAVYHHFQRNRQDNIIVISLNDAETGDLLAVKPIRSPIEYIWTLTPHLTRFAYDLLDVGNIAYMDADCFLFADLAPLYDEVGNAPVAIIPHRWTPKHADRLRSAGIYNVGWVYFSRDGLQCLEDWRDKCIEWCYWEVKADGRFADQGYLNSWDTQWGAHVVQQLGANLAPWNQEQYTYRVNGTDLIISDGKRADPLLFYHFHGFDGVHNRTGYTLHPMVAEHVYREYEAVWAKS